MPAQIVIAEEHIEAAAKRAILVCPLPTLSDKWLELGLNAPDGPRGVMIAKKDSSSAIVAINGLYVHKSMTDQIKFPGEDALRLAQSVIYTRGTNASIKAIRCATIAECEWVVIPLRVLKDNAQLYIRILANANQRYAHAPKILYHGLPGALQKEPNLPAYNQPASYQNGNRSLIPSFAAPIDFDKEHMASFSRNIISYVQNRHRFVSVSFGEATLFIGPDDPEIASHVSMQEYPNLSAIFERSSQATNGVNAWCCVDDRTSINLIVTTDRSAASNYNHAQNYMDDVKEQFKYET